MSNGTSKEIKVKIKPVQAINKTDLTFVATSVYTYKITYADYVKKVVVAGTTHTEDTTVAAADPDLADGTWAQYDGVLYIGLASYGSLTRKVIVTYELYFSETGVYDYRNIETSDGGTVFYKPYLIKRPTFKEILTSGAFGFIPSATTSVTIAHDGLDGKLDHWFRNQSCIVYDGSTTYKMIMTGSLSVKMPNCTLQIADQRELFNNESLEIVGQKYFGDNTLYFKGIKAAFGSALLDGYDENLDGEPIPAYLGLTGGVKGVNVAYTPGEIPVNHGTSTTENDKDYFNNAVYWVPNPGFYDAGAYTANLLYRFPLRATQDTVSGTRIYLSNLASYPSAFSVSDAVRVNGAPAGVTVSAVGTNYIDVSGSVTVSTGDSIVTYGDYITLGLPYISGTVTAGATTVTVSHTEGIYVGAVFTNDNTALTSHTITSINRDTNVLTFTPALSYNLLGPNFLNLRPYNSVTMIKNGNRIDLDPVKHLFLTSGTTVFSTSGGSTLTDPDHFGYGYLITLDWITIQTDFGFTLDGSEEVYFSGNFGDLNGTSEVNSVAGQSIQQQLTLGGDLIHPRNYESTNRNRTLSPSHAGWLLYIYLRNYVGIDEDDIETDSFLDIDVIDYGVQLSGGRLHRDVINEILKECMLRMFINASGKWELAKVGPFAAADYTISDVISITQKYSSNETYGRIHVKYKAAGESFKLYTYDIQSTQDAIDENRILQLDTNFASVDNPTLMAPRYAAVYGYKKGVTEVKLSKRYSNVLINDIITVEDDMFDGGSKTFVVIAINRQDDTITLTLDDQPGIEDNSSAFNIDDDLEGDV